MEEEQQEEEEQGSRRRRREPQDSQRQEDFGRRRITADLVSVAGAKEGAGAADSAWGLEAWELALDTQ